jgi:membrane-associated phospholipid phosphatase
MNELLAKVDAFDKRVDGAFERLRGNKAADFVFYGASRIGEHAMVWLALAALLRLRGRRYRRGAWRAAISVFVEAAVVNLGIKTLVGRKRPDHSGEHPHKLREPWTSSFPSGHASAAACAAILMSDADPSMAPAYGGLAAVIAASRVHVRMHHASDVIGGALVGSVIALVIRKLFPLGRSR